MERIKLDLTGGGFPFFNNGKELERGGKVADNLSKLIYLKIFSDNLRDFQIMLVSGQNH